MNKCTIYYHSLSDEMRKEDKLEWFSENKIQNIPFEHIQPDKNNNWINLIDNDWENMLLLIDEEVKSNKSNQAIFQLYSLGINTNRDEWVYDFDRSNLTNKMKYFIDSYNKLVESGVTSFPTSIKWSSSLKNYYYRKIKGSFESIYIQKSSFRPFVNYFHYTEKLFNHRLTDNHYKTFGSKLDFSNLTINFNSNDKEFFLLSTNQISDLHFTGDSQFIPLFVYSNDVPIHNITDWGLEQFQNNYNDNNISKEDIFNYVYAVLHNPQYRKKYELNLKREFPRIPFYDDFCKWSEWGKKLMDLHINFETIEPFPLNISTVELVREVYKPKLKANKDTGEIYLDNKTTLSGIPSQVWDYKLGNRSALEWILDQYKEKKPKDPTIAEKFNTYRFIDYKDKVIDLLMRVTTVSIETMKILKEMD